MTVGKRTVGRPLKFPSVEELEKMIEGYFNYCDNYISDGVTKDGVVYQFKDPLPYLISGLACYLDCDRDTILNYGEREQYFPTIKRAKEKCLKDSELRLHKHFTPGVIFSMKNNYGWCDKQEIVTKNYNFNEDVKNMTDEEIDRELKALEEDTK